MQFLRLTQRTRATRRNTAAAKGETLTAMIEIHGLTKTFPARQGAVEAVRGVAPRVEEGELFGFLSQNGAGNTCGLSLHMRCVTIPVYN